MYVDLPLVAEKDHLQNLGLKLSITGEGVWRIRRGENSSIIELSKYEESGYGDILSHEFAEWRECKTDSQAATWQAPA